MRRRWATVTISSRHPRQCRNGHAPSSALHSHRQRPVGQESRARQDDRAHRRPGACPVTPTRGRIHRGGAASHDRCRRDGHAQNDHRPAGARRTNAGSRPRAAHRRARTGRTDRRSRTGQRRRQRRARGNPRHRAQARGEPRRHAGVDHGLHRRSPAARAHRPVRCDRDLHAEHDLRQQHGVLGSNSAAAVYIRGIGQVDFARSRQNRVWASTSTGSTSRSRSAAC